MALFEDLLLVVDTVFLLFKHFFSFLLNDVFLTNQSKNTRETLKITEK